MQSSPTSPGPPLPKYCSVATTLKAPAPDRAAPAWDARCTCPLAPRAPWLPRHRGLTRCVSCHPCLYTAEPAWQGPDWLGSTGDATGSWVLARREPDGLFYRAQIKAAPKLEKRGALVVEFEAPLVTGLTSPAQQRSVVFREDVVALSPSEDGPLQPGDKVLASWEPEQQRFEPGTVLQGSRPRKSQKASREDKITVYFWHGKVAQVPTDRARRVPSTVWRKTVERLQMPHYRQHPGSHLCPPCGSCPGAVAGCAAHGPPLHTSFLCPSCCPHACGRPPCQGCCSPGGPTWWALRRSPDATVRELSEPQRKPPAPLLPIESRTEEALAALAPTVPATATTSSSSSSSSSSPSSSSSDEEENSKDDLDMELPRRQLVNSAVNTDPLLPEKSPRQSPGQPAWRYWRRHGPEPRPGKPGTRCCHTWKKDKQDRVQIAVVGTTQEPDLKAANSKPRQTLLKAGPTELRTAHGGGGRIPLR